MPDSYVRWLEFQHTPLPINSVTSWSSTRGLDISIFGASLRPSETAFGIYNSGMDRSAALFSGLRLHNLSIIRERSRIVERICISDQESFEEISGYD
jgi:hypothetical protein